MTRDDLVEDPVRWGKRLIETNDHDPLYVGLTNWDVKGSRLRRFMLAYWCCYSVGASHYISAQSGARFYELLMRAALNIEPNPQGERWPRAHERRHWRGDKCVKSVLWLIENFRHPEEAVLSLEGCRDLAAVQSRIAAWPQFGPWIGFKAADMLERVLGIPVEFPATIISMYKDPKEGADMMAPYLGLDTPQEVTDHLLDAYAGTIAPGYKKHSARLCNVQEVETVLCKWKSARKGHYWIGADTKSHRSELLEWGAQDLLDVYPTLQP